MAIKPLSLPSAAGLNRGGGDVRHFAEGDSMSVPAVSNPTRELAERDNLIAEKLNETLAVVNNKEQFVPIMVPRTTVSPNEEIVVTNYRIPEGFETRILNATVAAIPISSDIEFNVYYSTGFGNTTGTVLITTSSETTGGTSFQQNGELIITLKNKGGLTLDVVASLLLTMRPIGAEGSLLVGSVIQGQRGYPGQGGARGIKGDPGTGGAGSPGMIWTGDWTNGRGYNAKEVVSFELYGTVVSSFICLVGHTANPSNEPPDTTFWDAVAIGSSGSVVGIPGPVGPAGSAPTYSSVTLTGTLVPDGDYVGGTSENGYSGGGSAYGTNTVLFNQYFVDSGTQSSPIKGLVFLQANFRRAYNGNVKIFLPQIAPEGAKINWSNSSVVCQASINGSYSAFPVDTVQVVAVSANRFDVKVLSATPQKVAATFIGIQPIL